MALVAVLLIVMVTAQVYKRVLLFKVAEGVATVAVRAVPVG
jgi:hypothetical protein